MPASYGVVLSILFATGLIYTLLGALLLPAVRALSHSLHASQIDTTWVLTAYVLSGGVATPIAGRLGDMYGKKRALVWVLVVVAAGTVLCALSSSLVPMVAGRLISGVASGVFPLSYGIIRDEFPRERVATAIGVISVSVGIGTGVAVVSPAFWSRSSRTTGCSGSRSPGRCRLFWPPGGGFRSPPYAPAGGWTGSARS